MKVYFKSVILRCHLAWHQPNIHIRKEGEQKIKYLIQNFIPLLQNHYNIIHGYLHKMSMMTNRQIWIPLMHFQFNNLKTPYVTTWNYNNKYWTNLFSKNWAHFKNTYWKVKNMFWNILLSMQLSKYFIFFEVIILKHSYKLMMKKFQQYKLF